MHREAAEGRSSFNFCHKDSVSWSSHLSTVQPIAQTWEGLAKVTGRKVLAEVLSNLSLCIGLEDYSSSLC